MSSVEHLREFVSERLTAAAEEIFRVFQETIVEYEEEINRQGRLLDVVWKPEIKIHRIELPQQHVCKEEEVLAEQQLCNQERNSSVDQEDPEAPQMKEEQEKLCTSQEGEQLVVKQETDTFMLTPAHEESDHSGDETLYFDPDKSQSAAETRLPANTCISWLKDESDHDNSEVSEPKSDHLLLSNKSLLAESQDQKGGKHGDSGSTTDAEPGPKKQHHKRSSHSYNESNSNLSEIHHSTHTSKKSFKCDTCGKDFKFKSTLQRHLRSHTGETPYSCKTCGRDFRFSGNLTVHVRRAHNGEKPYLCEICGKRYFNVSDFSRHVRLHSRK